MNEPMNEPMNEEINNKLKKLDFPNLGVKECIKVPDNHVGGSARGKNAGHGRVWF